MLNMVAGSSLQRKVSVTLLAVMAALALLSYATLERIVAPAFDQLEMVEADTNLVRAERAIRNDLDYLSAITGDWAIWDDAHDYVSGSYSMFRESNLDRPTLTNLGLNLLAIYNGDDELVWGQVDYQDAATDILKLGILEPGTSTAAKLLTHVDLEGQVNGLVNTELGPMLISSWPILRSDNSGPIAGSLIMGQFMNEARMARLRERTEVQLAWQPVHETDIDPSLFLLPLNGSASGTIQHEVNATTVVSTGALADLSGNPLLILSVNTPRTISALGASTVNAAMLVLALAALVVAVVTWLLLRWIIVSPLEVLATHITHVRESGDLTHKLAAAGNDEIGALSRDFDKLTDELDEARSMLLAQSFKAGRADTAAEVLHNVRNAMTPLINGLDRLRRTFAATDKLKVDKALDELGGDSSPPGRAGKLIEYLRSAFSHVKANHEAAASDLKVAARQARQVEAIISDQEKHANVDPVIEKLRLEEVLHEAALILPERALPEVRLAMHEGVSELSVRAHRVGLIQVLGNLILNAYESIERSAPEHGMIELYAYRESVDDQEMVRLTIRDNGAGFDGESRDLIFRRGYSSKEGRKGGLGLHWCANAITAMGGRIVADSAGRGKGAEFHVLLPIAQGTQGDTQ